MTELTVIGTGEVVEAMSTVEAERITARIADKLDAIADNLEQVLPLIGEALTRRAWEAMGYASPTAYVSERFAGSLSRLTPEVRRPVVAQLSAAGMSTRAIAPVVGVSQSSVRDDIQVSRTYSPAPTDVSGALPEAPAVVGIDGKTYQRSATTEPPKPKRRPIAERAQEAEWELVRAIERIEALLDDDRFTANKEVVAPHLRSHLTNAIEACQGLLYRINH